MSATAQVNVKPVFQATTCTKIKLVSPLVHQAKVFILPRLIARITAMLVGILTAFTAKREQVMLARNATQAF